MIPVLLAGTIFGSKAQVASSSAARKYGVKKYISVLVITAGIIGTRYLLWSGIVFQLTSNHKKVSTQANSNLGLILLALSLCMGGVCGMQQDVVVPRYKPSSLRLQEMLNVYGIFVSFVASLFSQELKPGVEFLLKNKVCLGVGEAGRSES